MVDCVMGISKFHSRNNSQNYSLPLCSSIDRQDVLRFQEARDSRKPPADDRTADQVFAAARPQLQGGDILPLGGAGRERDGDGLRADKGAGVRRTRPPRPQRSAAVQPDLGEHRQMDMRAGAGLLQGQWICGQVPGCYKVSVQETSGNTAVYIKDYVPGDL